VTIHSLVLVQRTAHPITLDGQSIRTRLHDRHGDAHHLGDFSAGLLGSAQAMVKTVRSWLDGLEPDAGDATIKFQLVLGLDLTTRGGPARAAHLLSALAAPRALRGRLSWHREPRLDPDGLVLVEVGALEATEYDRLAVEELGTHARAWMKGWHPSKRGGPGDATPPRLRAALLDAGPRDVACWSWLQHDDQRVWASRAGAVSPLPARSWLSANFSTTP